MKERIAYWTKCKVSWFEPVHKRDFLLSIKNPITASFCIASQKPIKPQYKRFSALYYKESYEQWAFCFWGRIICGIFALVRKISHYNFCAHNNHLNDFIHNTPRLWEVFLMQPQKRFALMLSLANLLEIRFFYSSVMANI